MAQARETIEPRGRPAEEAALLRRAAAGDDRAFAVLYDAYRRRLHRLAYGVLLDPHEAREAVQEAFLRLHKAAPTWEPRASVGTWLHRVVLNHCLGVRQRLLRLVRPSRAVAARSPEQAVALCEAGAIARAAIAELPPRQRAIVCLFADGELAPSEIAPLVEMTPNATRVALHRALTHVRSKLADAGIDAPPTTDERDFFEEEA